MLLLARFVNSLRMINTSSFSVVICSYNPDSRLLRRLLKAISRLNDLQNVDQVVIVDNNSSPPLGEYPEVISFLASIDRSTCIVEETQGLSHARLRGIRETRSDFVVFFDDDNEPCSEYLELVRNAFLAYPNSGAWGAGKIAVEYIDDAPEEVRRNSAIFQERNLPFGYVCVPGQWSDFCPFGTGLAVTRQVLNAYARAYESGRLSMSDRKGTSLSSAGDVQIVWEAFSLGLSVGILPGVSCNHIINSFKATPEYCLRQKFWTASSYLPALIESFPTEKKPLGGKGSIGIKIRFIIASKHLLLKIKNSLSPRYAFERSLAFAVWLGTWHGDLVANKSHLANIVLREAKKRKLA